MSLKLAVSITVDSAGAVTGVQQLDKALDAVGGSARTLERDARAMEAALSRAANEASRAKAAAERAVGLQTIAPNRGADVAAYGRELDGLRAKYNPLFAAQREYKASLDEIRMAQRTGAISAGEAAAALDRTKAGFAAQVGAINASRSSLAGHAAQSKLTAQQSQQLSYQLNDVVVSLAGGMNPLTVMLQQGSQITPLFGGIGGTMRALVGAISPVYAGIGGLAVATAGGAVAWNSYLKSTLEVQTALSGLGRNSGATRRELEAIAQANAAAGGLTVSQARSIETQLLRTGKVGVESFGSVIRITRDFAATLGTDAETAAQKLAEILADPAKGAADLQRQYGLLDGATARYVERLQLLGREEEARKLILDRLPQQLASHREALTGWARLWDDVAKAAGRAWEAQGKSIDRAINGPSTELERLRSQLAEAEAREEARRADYGGSLGPSQADEIARLRERYRLEQDRLKVSDEAEKAAATRRKTENEAKDRADRAVGVAKSSPINELAERRRQLKLEIEQLEKGLQGKLDVDPAEDAARRREINATIEGKRAALEGLRPVQERQAELDRIDAAIAQARDPVTKAQLTALREKIALEEQEMSVAGRAQAIENARIKVLLEASSSGRTRAADIRDEAKARAAVNDAVAAGRVNITEIDRFMRTEQELRPLIIAHAKAEGAVKKELAAIINQLREASAASAREEARTGALQHIAGQKERLETLRAELALIGASEGTRSRMLALLEAEQTIRRGNIDGKSSEARQIRANAEAQVTLTAELERQKSAYTTLRSFGERSIDAIIDKIAEQGLSWQSMGDLAKSIFADLNKEMLRLVIGNPLKNALFGSNLPTIADAQGLFGGKNDGAGAAGVIAGVASKAVGAMTVNAASVIVNGGVTGQAGNALAGIAGGAGGAGTTGGTSGLAGGIGNVLGTASSFQDGVDPRLKDILTKAAARFPLKTELTSGLRPGDSRAHGQGLAADLRIFDEAGKPLANYQDASTFRTYEKFAQVAKSVQMEDYPELAEKFRFGGYFSGGKGKYGAVDPMHYDLAGRPGLGMAGGSWENGLTPQQRSLWPGIESQGMGSLSRATEAANENLSNLATTTNSANLGLDKFGNALSDIGRSTTNTSGGGGGGLGGLFSRVFGGGSGIDSNGIYNASSATGGLYHTGGMVGSGSGPGRNVPWSLFEGAPRYHSGGLLAGERPIIAKDGEGIFTPRQMDNADALIRAVAQRPSTGVEGASIGTSNVTVINNGQPVNATKTERVGSDGSRDITIVLDEMQAANAANANARTYQAIRKAHGTSPALLGRSR